MSDDKKIPEIRLDGFKGNWEYKKLGSLYENNNERNVDLIGFERTISIASMSFKDEGNGASE